jgi:exopolysaccharide production protein ExoQ
MPRQLAVLIFVLFIAWLWREDNKTRPTLSKALWIPLIWLLLLGSRPLSWWCWFFFNIGGSSSEMEGNSIDRIFYSVLILISLLIVKRRGVSWSDVFGGSLGFVLFYLFLAATILWSPFPIPTLKRWIKEIGAIPVLLIILTDANPIEAIKVVFTRCAYVIFSFSVLAIKYIPEIGREYHHSGGAEIRGIAPQKNSLGESVMVFGLVVLWQLLESRGKTLKDYFKRPNLQFAIVFVMGLWLLKQCNSMTSILCFAVGGGLLLSTKLDWLNSRRSGMVWFCFVAVPAFFILDKLFQISGPLLELVGRNPTLTNRTEIWDAVKHTPVNPIWGCGYLNYWDFIPTVEINGHQVGLKTAHNGYLEIFLDGGALGVFFLTLMLLNVGINRAKSFVRNHPLGVIGLSFFCMTLLNNVSESIFARRSPLWCAFLMVAIGYKLLAHTPEFRENTADESTPCEDPGMAGSVVL